MIFKESKEMKINILPEQEDQLCSKETIKRIFAKDEKGECVAFDIYEDDNMVGFAMFCNRSADGFGWFLWNYAIDAQYQNSGLGTKALKELLEYMVSYYDANLFTTTYEWGNDHAKHIYEKVGFIEKAIVEEDGCKEVDMIYKVD